MISLPIALLVGVVCVCFEGFFSGSEIAMVSVDRARLRARAQGGDRGARLAESFLLRPQVLLSTTLIGTNLATLVFSVTVAIALSGAAGGEFLAILMVTPMTLLLGEVVPKTVFQQYADSLVPRIVYPLRAASILLRPLVWAISGSAVVVTRLLRIERSKAFITREELLMLVEAEGSPESEITDGEREMIQNVLEMSEATVGDVMVPLSEVTALPNDTTVASAALEVADKQHSRMPVYEGRVDNIVGILHVFDLLLAGAPSKQRTVGEIARTATFVPENKPAVDMLVELQGTGNQMTVVVDEYGGATGVVSVEDLLEEIVGEIEDEYDTGPSPIRLERPGVWRTLARTSVERINEELGTELAEGDDFESVGGLMLDRFRRIPEAGESLVIGGVTLRAVRVSDRAIEEVQILRRKR